MASQFQPRHKGGFAFVFFSALDAEISDRFLRKTPTV
jgi:hypothetical protein